MRLFLTSILVACLAWTLAPTTAWGQNYAEILHRNDCTRNINLRTDALRNHQWESLASLARQFIGNCLDLYRDNTMEAGALWDIAIGLNNQGRFDEAIPILGRCVTVKPDAAYCFAELGAALEGLDNLVDARKAFERAVSIGGDDQINAGAIGFAQRELAAISRVEESRKTDTPRASEPSPPTESKKFGTGFYISAEGHILTNNHVVDGCKSLAIVPEGKPLALISRNTSTDLALLKADSTPDAFAVLRAGPAPKLGDSVVAFGFPLPGVLSSHGNVSIGILSATSGLQDDVRFIQISAPVQPGNSGGPLFDSTGHVIGVVVAKLDAIQIARATGDLPQNVNFAVHWSQVRAFLDEEGIPYRKTPSMRNLDTSTIAANATRISIKIECTQ